MATIRLVGMLKAAASNGMGHALGRMNESSNRRLTASRKLTISLNKSEAKRS